MQQEFTVGDVAALMKCSPRTIGRWFDSGRLKGYRIPGTHDRRIPREYLRFFLQEHGFTRELEQIESREPE